MTGNRPCLFSFFCATVKLSSTCFFDLFLGLQPYKVKIERIEQVTKFAEEVSKDLLHALASFVNLATILYNLLKIAAHY